MESKQNKDTISILGTGDFSRALSRKLGLHGYHVVCGSRRQATRKQAFLTRDNMFASLDVDITSIPECIASSDVILLALHPENIEQILQQNEEQITGKILVDVSNPTNAHHKDQSYVEYFADKYQHAIFVKALNSLSAYELDNEETVGDRVVCIAGDNLDANAKIEKIVRSLGYAVVMSGGLNTARQLEQMQTTLWRGWGTPCLITAGVFTAWGVYGTMRYQVWKGNPWSMLPVNTMNKVYGCTSLTLLSMCYLPGCIAATVQLINGTKHKAFPVWLDKWLKIRKELGLISLSLATTHCVLSVAHLSPAYFKNWYQTSFTAPVQNGTVTMPTSVIMNWKGETVICLGSLALGTMAILGVTSIPSVMTSLNWRQWNFIHTGIGYSCLALAASHVFMKGAPDWLGKPVIETAKGMAFLSLVLPAITLTSRAVLALPCVSHYVTKIRKGWERGSDED